METIVAAAWLGFILFIGLLSDRAQQLFVALMWFTLPFCGALLLCRLLIL